MTVGFYPDHTPFIPYLLIRHGFEFESIEEPRKAKLLYPDGKLKVVEF